MKILLSIVLAGILGVVGGCGEDNGTGSSLPAGDATYSVTFTATWSSDTHPKSFPGNPHFSPLVGATHDATVAFWLAGMPATPGIKSVAERGATATVLSEIALAIESETAQHSLSGGGIGLSPGEVSLTFAVTAEFPLLTLVSMLAPSPDWFVGVSGLSLWRNDAWLDALDVELFLHDAGTDSGTDYTSANESTIPAVAISRIEDSPVLIDGLIRSVGTFTFTRQN